MSPPPENPALPARKKRLSGVIVPHAPRWYQRLGAWLVFSAIRLAAATLRYRWNDHSGYFAAGAAGPAIYCIWHNRLLLSMRIYYGYVKPRNATSGLVALVSASKDGGFLAAILERFNVQPVRGSTSRRGPQALLELTTWAERGYDLAITPDGPRGPCYAVQEGIIALAQITGRPIVPVSYHLKWKLRLGSWDQFQIPLPLSACDMAFGKPIHVPREATDAEREDLRQGLERTLREMSKD